MKIPQYCSVCKAEYEMSVVPTADDDGVMWLQCPVCKGYLPKVRPAATESTEGATPSSAGAAAEVPDGGGDVGVRADEPADAAGAGKSPGEGTPADEPAVAEQNEGRAQLAEMDVDQAVPYRPWQSYAEGDVVHHLAWNDYGVVLDKEELPGGRRVIKVRFAEAGLVRLIEDDGTGSE